MPRHGPDRRSRGQSMVEFALVLPIFLMLVFGSADLGRVVFYQSLLNNAVRDGARYGTVSQDTTAIQQHIQASLHQFAGMSTTCAAIIYTAALLPGAPGCASVGTASPGNYGYVTVTATMPFNPIVGLYGNGWTVTLHSQSTMIFSP